jgi:hypothetical protein
VKRLITLTLSILSVIFFCCSDEGTWYPVFEWRSLVVFPEGFSIRNMVEGEPGEFYINGHLYDYANHVEYEFVYKYSEGKLNELFRKNVSGDQWRAYYCSGYGKGVYWAAGHGQAGDEHYTSVLRVIGEQCEELPGPDVDYFSPALIVSEGADEAYFFEGLVRWHFINGEWFQDELPFDYHHNFYVFNRANGILYNYEQPLEKDHRCRISHDYFESYVEEDVVLSGNCPLSSSDIRFSKAVLFGDKIYFTAQLLTDTRIWYAFVERSGVPGNGVYKVLYRRDKTLGEWGSTVAHAEGEVLSTLPGSTLMLHYKNGDVCLEDNAPYDIDRMVLSGGLIWAEGRRQEDEETMFYPEELLVHNPPY